MSLTYNGVPVKEIIYNGTALKQMDYNGVTVFKKGDDWSDKPYVAFIEENGERFNLWTQTYSDTSSVYKKTWDGTLYYSVDGETWRTWDGKLISSSDDGKLYLRGENNTYLTHATVAGSTKYFKFGLSDKRRIQCHGNIENLLNYKTVAAGEHPTMTDSCAFLFYECTSLTTAPELLITTLPTYCYNKMFYGCTSLTQAPELPATTLAASCYSGMFQGCTSLTQAPELPVTTLFPACYRYMFQGCTSLTQAPELPATTLAGSCYYHMFYGCTSLTGQIHLPASVSGNSNRLTYTDISGSSATIVFDL